MPLRSPILSALDPLTEAEGSVDPLGMQNASERLAERIFPDVTVRMSRIRLLTTTCFSAHVCSTPELSGQIAADGITPSWLVLEWYMIEAHVRAKLNADDDGDALAGWMKVRRALQLKQSVCASSYLKTPTVFGIHGISRRLATGLRLVTNDMRLDERGWDLLRIWEKEQKQPGFISAQAGEGVGGELVRELRKAVLDGMRQGKTSRPDRWPVWELLPPLLRSRKVGTREAGFLFDSLVTPMVGTRRGDPMGQEMRREMIEHLRRSGLVQEAEQEQPLVRRLIRRGASPELRARLLAIDAFEALCRPVTDAFDLILHLGREGHPTSPRDFAADPVGREIPERIAKSRESALGTAQLLEGDPEVARSVQRMAGLYAGVKTPEQVFEATLALHEETQRNKPPEGKRNWTERVRGESVLVRPQYRREYRPDGEDRYVHLYRMPSVSQFLVDLRRGEAP
jgi:hypothetical protein